MRNSFDCNCRVLASVFARSFGIVPTELTMPLYFFHLLSGDLRQPYTRGVDLPGDQAAFDHAVKVLQEKLRTYRSKRLNATGYCLEVADDNGNHLFDVPVGLPIIQQERDATRT
jgi:hypothetical protein